MNTSNFNKALQALTLSLLLHGIFTVGIYFAPELKMGPEPITVEIIDSSKPTQSVVDETELKPKDPLLEKLKTQTQLLSKYSKRVAKQQLARNKTGETKNRRGNSPINDQPSPPKLDLKPKVSLKKLGADKVAKQKSRPLHLPQVRGSMNNSVALGDSTSGNDIPGVKSGSFTALNTDQFTYYSFFERVNNAIRFRWISGVRKYTREAPPAEINRLAKVPTPTVIQVLLDREGMVVKVHVVASSGSKALDQAVIDAFYQASPLNHPPAGMIQEDRMVHLNYSFKVLFAPVYVAKDNP